MFCIGRGSVLAALKKAADIQQWRIGQRGRCPSLVLQVPLKKAAVSDGVRRKRFGRHFVSIKAPICPPFRTQAHGKAAAPIPPLHD